MSFNSVWIISSSIVKTKFVSNENLDMKKDILIYVYKINVYNENAIKTKIMYAKKYLENYLTDSIFHNFINLFEKMIILMSPIWAFNLRK